MTTNESAPSDEPPAPSGPKVRFKMADALRIEGVDEVAVAKKYKSFLERDGTKCTTQDFKLLLDAVRDCTKILEPLRPEGAASRETVVQLVHNVPRPKREAATAVGKTP